MIKLPSTCQLRLTKLSILNSQKTWEWMRMFRPGKCLQTLHLTSHQRWSHKLMNKLLNTCQLKLIKHWTHSFLTTWRWVKMLRHSRWHRISLLKCLLLQMGNNQLTKQDPQLPLYKTWTPLMHQFLPPLDSELQRLSLRSRQPSRLRNRYPKRPKHLMILRSSMMNHKMLRCLIKQQWKNKLKSITSLTLLWVKK